MSTTLNTLSLYPLVLGQSPHDLATNSVQTLLAISHSLEDVVMRHRLRLTFYAGFQRISSFLPQLERFARLAATCGEVLVLAHPDAPAPDIPGIRFIALDREAPLAREWFILVDHPQFGAALLTRQLGDGHSRVSGSMLDFGRGRLYEGLVTFEDSLVAAARRAIDQAVGREYVPVRRTPDALLAFESPYTVFGRSLVRHLEHNNQQVLGLYHTLAERTRELERLQGVVRTLVSHKAWQEAQATGSAEPRRRSTVEIQPLTILFTDVEGFTRLSEAADPEVLLDSLNEYLNILATTVYQHRGDVDKFLGDGMFAFFEDPAAALHAALWIQQRVSAFNAQQIAGLRPPLPTRVGLATGISLVGRVGSRDRQEITVLGDAVNLASRLQAHAAPGGLVMDHATFEAAGRPAAAWQTLVKVPGKSGTQMVFEVVPERLDDLQGDLARFEVARSGGSQG